jgi:hypothetical protein
LTNTLLHRKKSANHAASPAISPASHQLIAPPVG